MSAPKISKVPRPDDLIYCPYDPLHVMKARSFQHHLIRCSKNYPDWVICPYNATHRFATTIKLEAHQPICIDKPRAFDLDSNAQIRKYDGLYVPEIDSRVTVYSTPVPLTLSDGVGEGEEEEENWDITSPPAAALAAPPVGVTGHSTAAAGVVTLTTDTRAYQRGRGMTFHIADAVVTPPGGLAATQPAAAEYGQTVGSIELQCGPPAALGRGIGRGLRQ